MIRLAIIVPCYQEETVINNTTFKLTQIITNLVDKQKISDDSIILYVNDGSTDGSWNLISDFYNKNKYVCGINLASNVGLQNALMAGISVAKDICDVAITIDADLQDDVNVIEEMIDKYNSGFDIVYGVRKSRAKDSFFKRTTALGFYKLMHGMGVKSVYNHADFRLMSNRALEHLCKFKERNLFLRGIVPLIGYNTTSVYYDRSERFAGESKYPLSKMINFAIDGITSFSVKPVRMILCLGFIFILISLIVLFYVIYSYFINNVVPGWSSLMLSIWFCSGCVLIGMGIIGEYIGKIYIEVKNRPRYNIETMLIDKK